MIDLLFSLSGLKFRIIKEDKKEIIDLVWYDYNEYGIFFGYVEEKGRRYYKYISDDGKNWLTIEQYILNGEKF